MITFVLDKSKADDVAKFFDNLKATTLKALGEGQIVVLEQEADGEEVDLGGKVDFIHQGISYHLHFGRPARRAAAKASVQRGVAATLEA